MLAGGIQPVLGLSGQLPYVLLCWVVCDGSAKCMPGPVR
jgi:hypothetical protein